MKKTQYESLNCNYSVNVIVIQLFGGLSNARFVRLTALFFVSAQGFDVRNQNTQEVNNERFLYGLDKTMCKFMANVAFDKVTNGQTD